MKTDLKNFLLFFFLFLFLFIFFLLNCEIKFLFCGQPCISHLRGRTCSRKIDGVEPDKIWLCIPFPLVSRPLSIIDQDSLDQLLILRLRYTLSFLPFRHAVEAWAPISSALSTSSTTPPSSLPSACSLAEGLIRMCQGWLFHITQRKSGPSVSPFVHHTSGSDVGNLSTSRF